MALNSLFCADVPLRNYAQSRYDKATKGDTILRCIIRATSPICIMHPKQQKIQFMRQQEKVG